MTQQRVDEGPAAVARRRVNHHSSGLVHDDELFILIEHRQRDGLGQRAIGRGRRDLDRDGVSGLEPARGARLLAVDLAVAAVDQLLELRAAGDEGGELTGSEVAVQALTSLGFGDNELVE